MRLGYSADYNQFGMSVLVMLTLLGLLIASYLKLNIGWEAVGCLEKWCVEIPFSIYLGWITVATVSNVSDYLYLIGWNGFGLVPQVWAVIMLVMASLLGVLMTMTRRDAGYLLVLVWSFIGIAVKQSATPLVANSVWVLTLAIFGLASFSIFQRWRLPIPGG
jgi:benzodiazapine receptor